MEGRYGPYVSDGATHATLPKGTDPKAVTLAQAIEWVDAKAAKGPVKKKEILPETGRRQAEGLTEGKCLARSPLHQLRWSSRSGEE